MSAHYYVFSGKAAPLRFFTLHLHLFIIILIISLAGCQKDLDFKYHDIEPLTVIEAELTPEGARVAITLTTPMDEPMDRSRLTDATVTLYDIDEDVRFPLTADNEGYFRNPMPGIAGHDYRLTVERDGNIYQSEARMYPPTEIVSLEFNWINMPYDQVAVLQAQYLDNPAADQECYWVKLYRNGEIYSWHEQDDRGAIDGVATFFTMTSRRDTDEEDDDEVLFDGDVMTFSVCQISKGMHDYLEALQNDSNGPAMFSGPRVLGYFIASSPVSRSITFHPDRIPVFGNF
ncbi:MAG: DUF4249 domain-containing protein [Muribaculaceae bacterium]|nr:DUF4249 domain-containing protein [Muribaculaceae bacterium]